MSDNDRKTLDQLVAEEARDNAIAILRQRVDFLVGNAPPAPSWFKPIMPHQKPEHKLIAHDVHLNYYREFGRLPEGTRTYSTFGEGAKDHGDDVIDYMADARTEWELLHERERSLQWPLWWALEMIRRIDKPRATGIEISARDTETLMKSARSKERLYRLPYTKIYRVVDSGSNVCKHGLRLDETVICNDCASEIANNSQLSSQRD
jgi:hypothetical protein